MKQTEICSRFGAPYVGYDPNLSLKNKAMTDLKSNFRERFRHPDIVVSMPSGPEFGVKSILSYFEDEIRQGTVFRSGETVQMGWMLLMLKADENGDLDVWEPRFGEIPIIWVRGASKTYRQLVVQKSVAEQLGVEPSFPALTQSAVVSPEFMASTSFQMSRESSDGRDSGWFFTTDANVSNDGRPVSLFEIASKRPEVIPFLALPAASSAMLNNGRVQISHGDKVVDSNSSEILRRLAGGNLIS